MRFIFVLFGLMALCFTFSAAAIVLPTPYGDNMVLQLNTTHCLNGKATPGSSITMTFQEKVFKTETNPFGSFSICYKPKQDYRTKFSMSFVEKTLSGQKNRLKLKNVKIGFVFLGFGQSQMEMTVSLNRNASQFIANAYNPRIFMLTQTRASPATVQEYGTPYMGGWQMVTPASIGGPDWNAPSAVAYFAAVELDKLFGGKFYIGFVTCSRSGSPIEAFAPQYLLERCGSTPVQSGEWRQPTSQYKNLHAYLGFPVASVVLSHGEGNLGQNMTTYKCLVKNVFAHVREMNQSPNLPFLIMGVTPYDRNISTAQFADLRIAQEEIVEEFAGSILVPLQNLGDRQQSKRDSPLRANYTARYGGLLGLHQETKDKVGEVLARHIFNYIFDYVFDYAFGPNENVLRPALKHVSIERDRTNTTSVAKIFIENYSGLVFGPTDDCWTCCGTSGFANTFRVRLNNGTFVDPEINILPKGVIAASVVSDLDIDRVEYAYNDFPQCMLFDQTSGLPMSQFVHVDV